MRSLLFVGFIFLSASLQAASVTIDFDDIALGDYGGSLATPQGYQVQGQGFGPFGVADNGSGDHSLQISGSHDFGPLLRITNNSGELFSIQQMDVFFHDPDDCNADPNCYGTSSQRNVLIQAEDEFGYLIADMTVLHSNVLGWRTVTFDSAWVGIATVKVTGSMVTSSTTERGGYDNIVVTAVPIPAAVWLFGSALAGLGWLRRKQTD
jgi:hypothetical protein